MGSGNRRAVFLDRDGVLIEDRETYVRRWEDVEILSNSVAGCRKLVEAGFALVVVTNQAVVGRGHLSLEEAQEINQRILARFSSLGAEIRAAYICPHRPEDLCECRKPKPGMLLAAADDHQLDLEASFLIGDAVRDLQAAEAAGVAGILVRTGKGRDQEALLTESGIKPWGVFQDLGSAAEAILEAESRDNRPCS